MEAAKAQNWAVEPQGKRNMSFRQDFRLQWDMSSVIFAVYRIYISLSFSQSSNTLNHIIIDMPAMIAL
jgi:hypothetical protein